MHICRGSSQRSIFSWLWVYRYLHTNVTSDMSSLRLFCSRWNSFVLLALMSLYLYYFSSSFKNAWVIARTPVTWNRNSSEFLVSKSRDGFDVTFSTYNLTIDTSLPDSPDLVPPVLHHIALGKCRLKSSWLDARESCLQYHPDWGLYLWTDENASRFVQEHFPHFKETWDNYKYPIQRVDALRYMVLYEYGGIISLELSRLGTH